METKRIFLLTLLIGLAVTLHAQMESYLTYRRYTTQDGLPQMQTERLWQDSRGYIYIGTLSGFVRFDGRSFTPFLKGRRENIVEFVETGGQVRALGFRRQWLTDYNDVRMLPIDSRGYWQLNNLNADALPDGYVILENEQEQQRRLCRMTAHGFIPLLRGNLLDAMTPDRKLYVDSLGVLIPTQRGLYQLTRGSRQAVRLTSKGDIYTLMRTDSALLAFAADGIYAVSRNETRLVLATDWSAAAFGLTVKSLRSGELVIADEHTVYLYDGRSLRQIVTGINLVRDVLVDRWDRLWVATYQGAYCFFNRNFISHRLTDENDIVRALAADETDRVVMGTLNGKVLQSGETLISDDPSQYYGTSAVAIGRRVFMLCHSDVACVEDGHVHPLGLPQDRYKFLSKTEDGKLLIVTLKHIVTYDPETVQTDTLTSDIPYPWCAAMDGEGTLWAGSTLGVYSWNSGRKVVKADFPQRLIVTTMEADSSGTIFFASSDSLFMIHEGQVTPLNQQMPALAGHEVRALHVSPRGYLVVAVVDGLFVCRIGEDHELTDAHFFNHLNGFTMLEPLKAAMAETDDGTVWLSGVEEMTSFKPADLLDYNEEDTYVSPPTRWWQHWWVWFLGLLLMALAVWAVTRWYEKRRNHRRMIRLQREKLEKDQQIEAIRRKAIEADSTELAKDIVKMTERTTDERITFRTASGSIVVEISDIAFFKGDGNYSQIVTFHDKDTVLVGLGALEKMLSPETFVRADRSTLVNIHNIARLLPKQRRCIFRTASGQEVETTLLAPAFKRLQGLL